MKLSEAIKELESLSPSEKAIEIVLQALENYKRRYELAIKQNVKDYKNSRKKIKELIKNKSINISGFRCIAVQDLQELLK